MSERAPDPSADHFGPQGMRRFQIPGSYGVRLPDAVRETLAGTGVPLRVAPYFTAAGDSDGLTLGMDGGHRGVPVPEEQRDWPRIGTDPLAALCVRPDGAVQAVFPDIGEDDVFVSSGVREFNASLAALDGRLPVIAASTSLPVAAAAFRELTAELRRIDPAAFAERESWWPKVLDDVRHTLNFPFSSAFEYVDSSGAKQVVTGSTGPGLPHPEELVWHRLRAEGVAPEQVRRVYCELEPCMMPGHYCAVWLQATFPHAEFTHSFDYGATAESREEGLKELITFAAEQAGRG
ncbi:nucleic acid/nucleotide deaminase domain-containing protein [Streptomyces sp. NPDC090108]|uniref:nucleic acid/nucleotide deaminase domain-containing protein n=1 Tax=Streptomyces sp. NPDC090108 TaxID=3365947 RepID=UPI003823BD73